jgi:uncharacterized RmlC-like cupin family protein
MRHNYSLMDMDTSIVYKCSLSWVPEYQELMMTEAKNWRTDGVRVARAKSVKAAMSGKARATAFDFAGTDGKETWVGLVELRPNSKTGAHHHGRTEVAIYVVKGRGQIRWGERLEFAAEVAPGDFVHFPPYVPHQELNIESGETLDFVVVRSNSEGIAVSLDVEPVEPPEMVY